MEVLVVIDMQNDFIDGALGTKEAESIVPKVIDRIKCAKMLNELVVYTQDTHDENYLDTLEGINLPIPHCIRGTHGWDLPLELQKEIDETCNIRIEKNKFGTDNIAHEIYYFISAFKDYEPVDRIEVIGLCTDICVISNALILQAFFPEVEIVVRASCCAGVTPEKHKAALEVMKSCQINVVEEE